MTDQKYSYLSSSIVRQLAKYNGDISLHVSPYVQKIKGKVSWIKLKELFFSLSHL